MDIYDFFNLPSSGISSCVGTDGAVMCLLTLDAARYLALGEALIRGCKPPKRPGFLQFELLHRVSSTGRSIYHSQAGFDPPWVHSSGCLLEFDDVLAH